MKVSTLLYSGAVALFVAAGITEILERRAQEVTWSEAVRIQSDGKGSSSSQSSEQPRPSQPTV